MGMTFEEYQVEAARTMPSDKYPYEEEIALCYLGLLGECGEVIDLIKKELFHGHPRDAEKMKKELGDVLWYAANLERIFIEHSENKEWLKKQEPRKLGDVSFIQVLPDDRVSLLEAAFDLGYEVHEVVQGEAFVGVTGIASALAALANAYGCVGALEEVASMNVAKLRARYPDGFSEDISRARLTDKTAST